MYESHFHRGDTTNALPQQSGTRFLEEWLEFEHSRLPLKKSIPVESLVFNLKHLAKERAVDSGDFEAQFGPEAARFLKELGCDRVAADGDRIKLRLSNPKTIDMKIFKWDKIKFDTEISFKMSKSGDEITISDGKGINLISNSRFIPDKEFPSVRVRPGNLTLKNYRLGDYPIPEGAYESLNRIRKNLIE